MLFDEAIFFKNNEKYQTFVYSLQFKFAFSLIFFWFSRILWKVLLTLLYFTTKKLQLNSHYYQKICVSLQSKHFFHYKVCVDIYLKKRTSLLNQYIHISVLILKFTIILYTFKIQESLKNNMYSCYCCILILYFMSYDDASGTIDKFFSAKRNLHRKSIDIIWIYHFCLSKIFLFGYLCNNQIKSSEYCVQCTFQFNIFLSIKEKWD